MKEQEIAVLEDIVGGAVADDGAALAAQGINSVRASKMWEGGWFVGLVELYAGAAMFYGGWAYESLVN